MYVLCRYMTLPTYLPAQDQVITSGTAACQRTDVATVVNLDIQQSAQTPLIWRWCNNNNNNNNNNGSYRSLTIIIIRHGLMEANQPWGEPDSDARLLVMTVLSLPIFA
jgi:hypothetical protein